MRIGLVDLSHLTPLIIIRVYMQQQRGSWTLFEFSCAVGVWVM